MSIILAALIFSMAGEPAGAPQIASTEQPSTVPDFAAKFLESKAWDVPFEERTFADLDVDSSGYIEGSEMEGSTFTIRKSDSSSAVPDKVRTPSLAAADADRDGRIGFDEYRRWLDEMRDFGS